MSESQVIGRLITWLIGTRRPEGLKRRAPLQSLPPPFSHSTGCTSATQVCRAQLPDSALAIRQKGLNCQLPKVTYFDNQCFRSSPSESTHQLQLLALKRRRLEIQNSIPIVCIFLLQKPSPHSSKMQEQIKSLTIIQHDI
jgi:hypothetical protein